MEKLITFITILAWVFGIGSTLLLALRIYGQATYSKTEEQLDAALRGYRRVFPKMKPFIIAVLCWSWVLTFQVL